MFERFLLIPLLACLLFFALIAYGMGERSVREEAVSQGVAEYKCDPKTGNVTFTWIKK